MRSAFLNRVACLVFARFTLAIKSHIFTIIHLGPLPQLAYISSIFTILFSHKNKSIFIMLS